MAPIPCCFDQTAVWHSDAARGPSTPSFDHLVGALLQKQRHLDAKHLCGLKVNHQLKLDRRLGRKITRVRTLEDTMDISRRAPKIIALVCSVRQQAAEFGKEAVWIDGRQAVANRHRRNLR